MLNSYFLFDTFSGAAGAVFQIFSKQPLFHRSDPHRRCRHSVDSTRPEIRNGGAFGVRTESRRCRPGKNSTANPPNSRKMTDAARAERRDVTATKTKCNLLVPGPRWNRQINACWSMPKTQWRAYTSTRRFIDGNADLPVPKSGPSPPNNAPIVWRVCGDVDPGLLFLHASFEWRYFCPSIKNDYCRVLCFSKGGWEGVVTCVYGIETCLYSWLAWGVFNGCFGRWDSVD